MRLRAVIDTHLSVKACYTYRLAAQATGPLPRDAQERFLALKTDHIPR